MDALEFGVRELPNPSNGFPQVSGLEFDLNTDIDSSGKTENNKFINVVGERRVSNVKVNGENLNLTKLYNISLLEFIRNGGDGYSMFTKYRVHNESIHTDTDPLIYHIKNNLNHKILGKYKELQRRLNMNDSPDSEAKDNILPNIILIAFYAFEFSEETYRVKFNTIVGIFNYTDDEVENITMKLDIEYIKLRFLEEEEVTCIKYQQRILEIYDFICSKEVSGPFSQINVISDNIIINGKIPINSSSSETAKDDGENIQNQTISSFFRRRYSNITFNNCFVYAENNKLIFGGDNVIITMSSTISMLYFAQDEKMEIIMCDMSDEGNNKFKMVCEATSSIKVDFFGNNDIYIIGLDKDIMMEFEEGKSFVYLELGNNYKKISNGGASKSSITFLVILIIIFIAIIITIVCLCKKVISLQKENAQNQSISEKDKTIPYLETSKGKSSVKDISEKNI